MVASNSSASAAPAPDVVAGMAVPSGNLKRPPASTPDGSEIPVRAPLGSSGDGAPLSPMSRSDPAGGIAAEVERQETERAEDERRRRRSR
jgi:hypothetical protein